MKWGLRPLVSFVRVPPIANLWLEETPIYKQMKMRFTIYVHLKVPHDTPPLRGFQPLVSLILDFRVSSPWKQLLNILGFGADIGRFQADLWSI
jgi:hypothetical protein